MRITFQIAIILILISCSQGDNQKNISENKLVEDPEILSYVVDLKKSKLDFFYKYDNENNFRNHKALRLWLESKGKELLFAVNGGMYTKELNPQGLYIENGVEIQKIDLQKEGYGNFYLKPNGIFYITNNNEAKIVISENLKNKSEIKYATQSGPMLVVENKIHSKLTKGSENVHIRNGVGILPNGNMLFAMSKEKINFYDFATFFKKNKCKNALYLDGFVSRTFLPAKDWIQEDGNFGVIIAETKIIEKLKN